MNRKVKISELPDFDMAEHLGSEADIAAYLNIVLEECDSSELAHALGVAAKARGMADVAEASGLTRDPHEKSQPCGWLFCVRCCLRTVRATQRALWRRRRTPTAARPSPRLSRPSSPSVGTGCTGEPATLTSRTALDGCKRCAGSPG